MWPIAQIEINCLMSASALCVLPGARPIVSTKSRVSLVIKVRLGAQAELRAGWATLTPDSALNTPRLNTNRLTYLPNKFHLGQEFLSSPPSHEILPVSVVSGAQEPALATDSKNWTNGPACQHQRHLLSSKCLADPHCLQRYGHTRSDIRQSFVPNKLQSSKFNNGHTGTM